MLDYFTASDNISYGESNSFLSDDEDYIYNEDYSDSEWQEEENPWSPEEIEVLFNGLVQGLTAVT